MGPEGPLGELHVTLMQPVAPVEGYAANALHSMPADALSESAACTLLANNSVPLTICTLVALGSPVSS
jgi:hypothetical protein